MSLRRAGLALLRQQGAPLVESLSATTQQAQGCVARAAGPRLLFNGRGSRRRRAAPDPRSCLTNPLAMLLLQGCA